MAATKLQRQSLSMMSENAAFTMVRDHLKHRSSHLRKLTSGVGFFQVTGHRVPLELQEALLQNVKDFFALPKEEKELVHKGTVLTWLMVT